VLLLALAVALVVGSVSEGAWDTLRVGERREGDGEGKALEGDGEGAVDRRAPTGDGDFLVAAATPFVLLLLCGCGESDGVGSAVVIVVVMCGELGSTST
jgi:hypothetical protein